MINKRDEKLQTKLEINLCESVICYLLTFGTTNLKDWLEVLSYDKITYEKSIYNFSKEHPSVIYYEELKKIKDEQYKQVAEKLKEKVKIFYDKDQNYFSINNVASEEEVSILAEIIICSSNYTTMDEYIEETMRKRVFYMLGVTIYEGRGCEKNAEEGIGWLTLSAEQGYSYAIYKLAEIDYYRNNELEAVLRLNKLLTTRDKNLIQLVYNLLGQIYYYGGNNVKADFDSAFRFFSNSTQIISSKEHIGKAYYYGKGTKKDYAKAFKIFSNLKEESELALFYLGEMYRLGQYVDKDLKVAYDYYKKSAERNFPQAQYELGWAYIKGNGIEEDIEKAIFWLEKASTHNYSDALYTLGILYYYGQDTGYDIPRKEEYAIELLERAIKEGCEEAKEELEEIKKLTHFSEQTINAEKHIETNKLIHHDSAERASNEKHG